MSKGTFFTYKGITFCTVVTQPEVLSYVENEFQLLDDDVVTVTYPKSGTNWILEIQGLIRYDGDPTWVYNVAVIRRSPWIESFEGLDIALKYPPPRLLTSHLPFQFFPKSFHHSKPKIIYIMRNPKDVMVSYYHFAKFCKGYKDPGTIEEFLEKFLSGDVTHGSWFDHVKGWLELKDTPNIFMITYEELHQDLRGSVERICQFLGKKLNSQQIDSVVDYASFQKMKDNNMSNLTQAPDYLFEFNKGKMMRKGICGDWKNHLTVAQSERFDCVYQEKMRNVNVTFPWD